MSGRLGIKFIPVSMCAVYSCTIATANEGFLSCAKSSRVSLAVWILQFKNSLCSVQVSVFFIYKTTFYTKELSFDV